MAENYKVVQVTYTEEYLIPMYDDAETTKINEWKIEKVVKDWFEGNINSYHATRDGHRTGNSKKFINYTVLGDVVI